MSKGDRNIRIARKHLIFSFGIAEHFDTYFSQVRPSETEFGLMVDFSEPRLHTLANGLLFELSSFPEELPTLEAYFRYSRPESGDLVFDVGAYCGVFTHELARIVGPRGKVIAFEPDPVNVELLRRNIARYGLANVIVAQVALSDKDGSAEFNSDGALGSALTMSLGRPATNGTVTVETLTLESACRLYGTPVFIKVDAEGSEVEILSAAIEFLHENPIPIVLDTSHVRDGKRTHLAVESLLSRAGYRADSSADQGGLMTTWGVCSPRQG